ncbi:MAG: ribonuclease P protein component [Burkholderiaceae bacterium]
MGGKAQAGRIAGVSSGGPRTGSRSRTLNGPHIQVKWRPAAPAGRSADPKALQPVLMMAVAKRLLPRAIDRNRFRRVVREAWRARVSASGMRPPAASVFVRLMRRSDVWRTVPDGQLKRAWRDEIDRLFAAVPGGDRGDGAGRASVGDAR